MAWRVASYKDLPELERFLLKTEWKAVAFSSRVKQENFLFEKNGNILLVNYQNQFIEEALMFTQAGILIPLLQYQTDIAAADNWRSIKTVLNFYPGLYSVMGIRRDVLKLENLLAINHKRSTDYYLMTLHKEEWNPAKHNAPEGLIIRKATSNDLKSLLSLQEKYEIEEVCLHPSRFSRRACFLNLKKNLVHELIFKAEMDGIMVAKAATNARGYNTDQLGGVYTLPKKRNSGIGYRITQELLNCIFSKKQMAVLFVKLSNAAAIKLYKNLGFREVDKYRITYYNV